ncbi:4Fe-4S ferredoxin, iron-sulfur binding protein [Thermodesulfatator indicus DSM 15286]|uniref:4Fe-4S ferredoxin, iron-sulfur binding protein n=1 Tax=Thermodesulfatator indicus (strain DSM 15286 / JCM 11887 / CIR29812) TaxID=667014 RepID=F8ADA7_THEID|nr:4Fe-4S dicluster domain-containing protein [Thermodesulfatator indicus]AEH45922.1 4Fe-4S ferredoxin, iron-sulfur binding protein [Thermodesulfatator indicus DSM 15286]
MIWSLPKKALSLWLDFLSEKGALFVPENQGFEPYQGKVFLEGKPRLSIKSFFLPWREPILFFESIPGAIPEKISPETKGIIFGVLPCDAKGITLIEKVFKDDPFFKDRRRHFSLIGFIREKSEGCFCDAMGVDPFKGEGLDLLVLPGEDSFLVQVIKKRALELLPPQAREASPEEIELFQKTQVDFKKRAYVSPLWEKLKKTEVMPLYEASFWEELSFPCLNCGICTFICPTCYCFDVQDEVIGKEGIRIRLPDACMFPLYSQHASGHNPRREPLARFRNRFMHKFKYFLDEYGEPLCVGCGRCNEACPAGINLWDVLKAMGEVA